MRAPSIPDPYPFLPTGEPPATGLWARVHSAFLAQLDPVNRDMMKGLRLVEIDRDSVVLSIANAHLRRCLQARHMPLLLRLWGEAAPGLAHVRVITRDAAMRPNRMFEEKPEPPAAPPVRLPPRLVCTNPAAFAVALPDKSRIREAVDTGESVDQLRVRLNGRKIFIEAIVETVCRHEARKLAQGQKGEPPWQEVRRAVLAKGRKHGPTVIRQTVMYLACQMAETTLEEIGRQVGGRDHTTVLHGLRRVKERLAAEPAFVEEVESLTRQIYLGVLAYYAAKETAFRPTTAVA